MYPQEELIRLAAYKAALRRTIAVRRGECAAAARQLAQPVAWLERMLAVLRLISPLAAVAAVPLGALVQRTLFPRSKFLGTLLRWGPLVFSAIRGFGARSDARPRPARSSREPAGSHAPRPQS